MGEEFPNVTKHGSNQPAAIATNRCSRSSSQRHAAQSEVETRTRIVGDSIVRNISIRTTTTAFLKPLSRIWTRNFCKLNEAQDCKSSHHPCGEEWYSERAVRTPSVNSLKHLKSWSSVVHRWTTPSKGNKHVFTAAWAEYMATKNLQYKRSQLHPLGLDGTHTPRQSMSDHRTSYQLPSHHVADTSHKDTDNTTQPKQPLLMDIPAEPCLQSSSHADCDVSQQLQDSAPKDDFLENSQGSQDNISQPLETQELEPISPDTLSLSPASLSFSQKMEELVYPGTKLSHAFAASPQISTKKMAGRTTTKDIRLSSRSSSCESYPTTPEPKPSSISCRWTKNNW